MEKKTIGKFISVLRRANGMTQKELGEKLYVSDKTVSRWERDECEPELSLLPAIAEIFGITTDELLRGERTSGAAEASQGQRAKSDKQFKTMLHNRMVRFRNLSMVSVGMALAAVVLAAVINVSFWKGILAFGIGAVVILAAIVCQLCVASSLLIRLDEEDDTYETQIRQANSGTITGTAGVLMAILSMFAFILPMGILGGSHYGLSTGSMLLLGCGCSVGMLIVAYMLYILVVRKLLVDRAMICGTEADIRCRKLLKRMLRRCALVLALLAAAFALVRYAGPEICARQVNTFTDPEEFQRFMQRGAEQRWIEDTVRERGTEAIAAPTCVFIDVGNDGLYEDVLFPPEFEQAKITSSDGEVLCAYAYYEPFVRDVRCKMDDAAGTRTITAYTWQGIEEAQDLCDQVCGVILVLMMVNVAAWTVGYIVMAYRKEQQ